MSSQVDDFDRSVFINCPFDTQYNPLRQALLFVILDCGLEPRIASEQFDSGQPRIERIRKLIPACRFSVHDISRMQPLRAGSLPRFNMPFELGLDFGCRYYGDARLAAKQCLILEEKRSRYRRVLSDIAGHDVVSHARDPETLVAEVRNWLAATATDLPSGSRIWLRFSVFCSHLKISLQRRHYTKREIEGLSPGELIRSIKEWQEKEPSLAAAE